MTSGFSTMSFAERYGVFTAHDPRFDGQFFSMVRSTGIYCRPSCSVRVPKPENMSFVATSAAAHEAGYRACKLCLPEMVPGSPEWDSRSDAVGRAMRLIREGWVEREGVAGVAAHLGCSARRLTELLTDELGAGPLALARAQRARTAQMLLQRTDLPMADVAASAGFTSTRQFGDTIRKVFALTPSQLRARRKGEVSPGETIDLVLPHRAPIDLEGVFAWLAARSIAGVEIGEPDSYTRLLALPGGHAWVRVYRSGEQLRLQTRLQDLGDLPALIAAVRRLFDLDADPVATDDALAAIPGLAPLVEATPGIRVPGTLAPDEMLIRAMIGQQVTVSAARTALTRLAEALGRRVEGHDGVGLLFPTMEAIAEHGHEVLRGPAARIRAIVGVASALASGEIVLRPSDDSSAQREALLSLPGVGPWTADYVRMRVTGDPDVFLPGDVAVRNGAALAGLPSSARELDDWSTRAAPRRSYLCAHLWRAPKVLG